MTHVISLFVGLIFSLGLGLSGMTQPQKVVGFLDIFGDWDPTLAFVMGGAVLVHGIAFPLIVKRKSPLLVTQWHLPQSSELSGRLLTGSFLFGVGWAMAGYCPGPALTAVASLSVEPLIFVASMIVGMGFFEIFESRFSQARA